MNKKKLYIGLGVLAIVGIGGFLIYKRRKAKSKEITVTIDPSGGSLLPNYDGENSTPPPQKNSTSLLGGSTAIQKAIKIAQERGINPDYLNKRLS